MVILPDYFPVHPRHRARGLHGLLAGRMGVFSLGSIGAGSCCCGPAPTCTTKVVCTSCSTGETTGPATNVLVTILNGTDEVSSGTTDSTGSVTLTIPATGTFTLTTSGNARYTPTSGTGRITCGGVTTVPLSPADGFICFPCWAEPIPTNLTVTCAGVETVVNVGEGGLFSVCLSVSPPGSAITTPSGLCNGSITSDPCTENTDPVGVQITAFITDESGSACNATQEWQVATACTVPSDGGGDAAFEFYSAGAPDCLFSPGVQDMWSPTEFTCDVQITQIENVEASFGTGNPVPVNITVNFPAGPISGLAAPVASLTITE
jgi:hypothetical protein